MSATVFPALARRWTSTATSSVHSIAGRPPGSGVEGSGFRRLRFALGERGAAFFRAAFRVVLVRPLPPDALVFRAVTAPL